jgi:rhodanese-related sulfurtransferase
VQDEFRDVPGVGVEEVRAMLAEGKPLQLIDTRPKHFVSRQQDIAEGVTWRDPERVGEWMGELSKEKPVVVYCAYGFHVGCRTAIALRDAGFDARYMTVGHSGWKAVGAPVKMTDERCHEVCNDRRARAGIDPSQKRSCCVDEPAAVFGSLRGRLSQPCQRRCLCSHADAHPGAERRFPCQRAHS